MKRSPTSTKTLRPPEFKNIAGGVIIPSDHNAIPSDREIIYFLEGVYMEFVGLSDGLMSLVRAAHEYGGAAEKQNFQLDCFRPRRNMRNAQEVHRYKRFARCQALQFVEKTNGKSKCTWQEIEHCKPEVENRSPKTKCITGAVKADGGAKRTNICRYNARDTTD